MKRLFIFLLVLTLLVFSGCNKSNITVNSDIDLVSNDISSENSSENSSSEDSSNEESSLSSVNIDTADIDYTEYLSFLEGKTVIESTAFGESAVTHELSSFLPRTDSVVLAKVNDISYKAMLGTGGAWTAANIEIIKSYRGNFEKGDTLDIYYVGGYISVEDHIKLCNDGFRFEDMTDEEKANTYFHEIVNGENFNPVGKTYLFCISPTLEGSPLPEGAYERLHVYTQMEYFEETSTFIQTLWDRLEKPKNSYTEDEIIRAVNSYK